ncbi:nuclear transport factor 2 family protein [Gemmatimonadota bacterium]
MKRILVAVLLLVVAAGPVVAQNGTDKAAEREGVIAAALDYMEGALTADADRMARGVHPGLTKVVISTNRQTGRQSLSYNTATLLVEWVRSAGDRMAEVDKNVDVTVFDIGNNLATARAIGQMWYDFLQLAKIDGEWRLVNVLWASNRSEVEDQTGVMPDARDSSNIVATALNYIDGSFSGDAGRMESALHPELTKILLTSDGTTGRQFLHKMGAANLIEGTRAGMGMVDEAERDIEVEINDVSHGIAAVKVTSSRYIDHLQMGKVNGEWKIINVLWVPNPDRPRQGR